MPGASAYRRGGPIAARLILRLLVALGLVIDAVVHLRLASGYQAAAPGGIGEGTLFRIEAGLAILVAVAVLIRADRVVSALAFLVAAAALGAVLLYRYVDVPAIGPLPSMYEPIWFGEKTLSAVAEAVAGLGSLVLLRMTWRHPHDAAPAAAPNFTTTPPGKRRRATPSSSAGGRRSE
jgi:hypothetical protein